MIDPDRIYTLAQARDLIPSSYRNKRLSMETLHRWRLKGRFKATCRVEGGRRFWYVRGGELLKLIGERGTRRRDGPCDPTEADARFAELAPGKIKRKAP
jgi:hypothetical protein